MTSVMPVSSLQHSFHWQECGAFAFVFLPGKSKAIFQPKGLALRISFVDAQADLLKAQLRQIGKTVGDDRCSDALTLQLGVHRKET